MATRQERLNMAIAAAHANGETPINDSSLSGLASKCVPCPTCDGAGMDKELIVYRNIQLCKNCNGRGYVSLAQPNKIAFDFGLSTRVK